MRNSDVLDALFPGVRQKLLSATLTRPDKWWHLSELAKFLHVRPSSLQRELASLTESGILEMRPDGRRTCYKAETRSPVFRDLRGIFEKTTGLVPVLKSALHPFSQRISCAFVYGSVARSEDRTGSDVDLMVIGGVGLAELVPFLRKAEKNLGREINVTNYSADEFQRKITQRNHFLTTVLQDDILFVKGEKRDLEAITRRP